ncbi:hypothetical protein ACSVDE_16050 [Pseudalkalibacillus sp. Hm43]|uniref:hypothetical protein n=1 Tax=Pseudalkalibacillus sp. Hm43 TaxID=3450742 RepID=UPI003F42C294
MQKIGLSLLVSVGLLTACNTHSHNDFEVVEEGTSSSQEKKPSLQTELKKQDGKVFLYVETDLVVSKENYGAKKINGQGHIHVYVNNGEKQGVTTFPHELKNLEKGTNQIKVSLHNNDHTPYGVSETMEIEMNK